MTEIQSYKDLSETAVKNELDEAEESIHRKGIYLKKSLLKVSEIDIIRKKMDLIWDLQLQEYGEDFLKNINEFGTVRCMMKYL